MLRYIRVKRDGQPIKSTVNHREFLQKYGYKISEDGDFIAVECSGVVEGEVDVSNPTKVKEFVTDMVKKHKVFSYQTAFRFANGSVLHGVFACRKLGKLSALVTRESNTEKAKPTNFLDEIL